MTSAHTKSLLLLLLILSATMGRLNGQCLPAGSYTINSTLPTGGGNYQSFNQAVAAMACGIQGGVTFTVAYGSGPYNEQVTIPVISGAGPTARVVFDGQHRDSTIISHDGQGTWATMVLNGADYIDIKNITIRNTSAGAGIGLHLTAAADNNTFKNSRVLLDVATVNTNVYGILASASLSSVTSEGNTANFFWVDSVTIMGGYGGIRLEGQSSNLLKKNRITNSHISLAYNVGILTDDNDSLVIAHNKVSDLRDDLNADGFSITDAKNYFEIVGNQLYVPDWGLLVNGGNAGNLVSRGKIVNNFIASTGDFALYMLSSEKIDIWHNTLVGTTGVRLVNSNKKLDIRNNIIYGTISYALENNAVDTLGHYDGIDYNIYYSDGPDLIKSGGSANNFIYPTLADWILASPFYNANSIHGKPVFYGPTNLHVLDTLANNKGDNSVGIAVDIDYDSRPMAPSIRVDIGADEYQPFSNNIAITRYLLPQPADCGDSTLPVRVVLYNQGTNPQTGFSITATITGPGGTQNISTTYSGNLAPWAYDTVTIGTVNTFQGGMFDFFVEHHLAGDQYPSNDTLRKAFNLLAKQLPPTGLGDTVCVGGSAELTTTASGFISLDWFADAAATMNVGDGQVYFTPTLNATQTYYLRGQQGSVERVGKAAPGTPLSFFISTTPGWGLEFDLARSISIDSVTMYPNGTGDFSIAIYPVAGGNAVYTSPVFNVSGANGNRVQYYLGALLPEGRYIMSIATANGVDFARDQSGATHPYVSPSGFVSIIGGKQGFNTSPSQTNYYWFYDWVVRIPSCYSALTPVVAFVSDSLSDAGNNVTICRGDDATLAAGNGTAWIWSTSETTQSIEVSPANTNTYTLTITDANGCPGRAGSVTVIVNSLPTVYAGVDTAFCDGDTITLSATGATSYAWSNGINGADIDVAATGSYSVTGTDANGCVASDTVTVSQLSLPNVSAGNDIIICDGDTATLTASGADTYDWSNNTSGASTDVSAAGNFVVIGTALNGCVAADTVSVSLSVPTVAASADVAICAGDTATLTASGADSYDWSTGAAGASIDVTVDDDYVVYGTDVNGCVATDTVTVTVNSLPTPNAGTNQTICAGDSATLSVVGGNTFVWSNTETTSLITVSPSNTTTYAVTATDQNNCSATAAVTVNVNQLPTIAFTVADTLCQQLQQVILTATPAGGIFLGPGIAGDTLNLQGLSAPDSYTLEYSYTDANNCSATSSQDVFVDVCSGIGEVSMLRNVNVYPNPFSGILNISINTENGEPVTVSVYDLVGRKVYGNNFAVTPGMENTNVLQLGNILSEGTYVVEIIQSQESYRQQIIFVR